jgi:hypothetical protein
MICLGMDLSWSAAVCLTFIGLPTKSHDEIDDKTANAARLQNWQDYKKLGGTK